MIIIANDNGTVRFGLLRFRLGVVVMVVYACVIDTLKNIAEIASSADALYTSRGTLTAAAAAVSAIHILPPIWWNGVLCTLNIGFRTMENV